jgi:hypothetical protein
MNFIIVKKEEESKTLLSSENTKRMKRLFFFYFSEKPWSTKNIKNQIKMNSFVKVAIISENIK